MKVLVLGGTGLIGRQILNILHSKGHQAISGSPSSGVNAVTGDGLTQAMASTDVVIDVTNSPSFVPEDVLRFFTASTSNIGSSAKTCGVRHLVALSIVGTDRMPATGYIHGKQEQERLLRESGVPYTIVRATQFFEFLSSIALGCAQEDGVVHLPPVLMQPIAAADVAALVADAALAEPKNGVMEVAGRDRSPMVEFTKRVLARQGDTRRVLVDPEANYFGVEVNETSLVPLQEATVGITRFDDWLAAAD